MLVNFFIYAALQQFQNCRNLGVFPLPSTLSISILPYYSLPLKPTLILCHPLLEFQMPPPPILQVQDFCFWFLLMLMIHPFLIIHRLCHQQGQNVMSMQRVRRLRVL